MTKLKIASVIGAILVGIEIAAQAVANNFMGFRDWIENVYNSLVRLAPAFKPVIDAIWTIGQGLNALFTGDIDALKKMFAGAPEAATATAVGIDDVTESGKEANKEL